MYGTLGFSDNNLQGTGNSGSLQFEKGARTGVAQLSVRVPYLGNTPQSQKYSVGGSLFTNNTTYYYPVYNVTSTRPVDSVDRRNAGADSGDAVSGRE